MHLTELRFSGVAAPHFVLCFWAGRSAFPSSISQPNFLMATLLQERQKQLESLGISLQSSGIKVGDNKCFLVNLNADPALNELLVYYLKVKIHIDMYVFIYLLTEVEL